ncbi:MAG: hypothetical protein ACLS23_07950 [Clostridioides difficile]
MKISSFHKMFTITWKHIANGEKAEQEWNELFSKYEEAYPELASEYKNGMNLT